MSLQSPFPPVFTTPREEAGLRVTLEFDRESGELLGVDGGIDAVKLACGWLAAGIEETIDALASTDAGVPASTGTDHWTSDFVNDDEDLRWQASPSALLKSLRRERELSSTGLRLVGGECERELHSPPSSHQTALQDRELLPAVEPRDERPGGMLDVRHRCHSATRSGGKENAAGSGPEGPRNPQTMPIPRRRSAAVESARLRPRCARGIRNPAGAGS